MTSILAAGFAFADDVGSLSPRPDPGAAADGRPTAAQRFQLPRSNSHNIYFAPGSSNLGESAHASLAAAARRLKAVPALSVSLMAYTDAWENSEYGAELRRTRVAAVVDDLAALGIHSNRILATDGNERERRTAPCTSEYCRQSYRRVGIEYFKSSGTRRQ